MQVPPLKQRYFVKLTTNLFGLFIGFGTITITSRALGPETLGQFSFISDFFLRLVPFVTLSTSMAFYTKISQRPDDLELISFYTRILILAAVIACSIVLVIFLTNMQEVVWPEVNSAIIFLGLGYLVLTLFEKTQGQLADAYGITVKAEKIKLARRLIVLFLIFTTWQFHMLNLTTYFSIHFLAMAFVILSIFIIINVSVGNIYKMWRISKVNRTKYVKEFYSYSKPLFIYASVGLFFGVFDRWLLQYIGGSVEQGYFALAYKVGSFCFLFTSAMTPLIMREFSIAFHKNDLKKAAHIFRRNIPLLYSIAAFISIFIISSAENVTIIIGGQSFAKASLPLLIMVLYPIHQTYGQLSGSVFHASGQTILYRNVGIIMMVVGSIVTWILLAPDRYYGLNLGATGLALKFITIQFVTVNVQLFFNSRLLSLSFVKLLAHQVIVILALLGISALANYTVGVFYSGNSIFFDLLLSGVIYTMVTLSVIVVYPKIFGLYRQDIDKIRSKLGITDG